MRKRRLQLDKEIVTQSVEYGGISYTKLLETLISYVTGKILDSILEYSAQHCTDGCDTGGGTGACSLTCQQPGEPAC